MGNDLIKNKYKIEEKLGQGSFGSAYKVLNNQDNKEYVIKEIQLNDKSEKEKEDIYSEGKLLSKLDSEYVVKYYDSFVENSKYYLVMEFCDGDSLDHFIKECKTKNQLIPEKLIIYIFKQILLGLKKIHEQNIIHRDLKPANIFLSKKDKKLKIGDFGISKETDSNKKYAKTQIGTIIYMSPELIQGEKYTNKTDIWSVGCILYELCTLNYVFPSLDLFSFINSVVNDKPKKIDKIYGKELQVLIDLLLEKDPLKRPDINFALNELIKCEMEYENKIDNLNNILESQLIPEEELQNMKIEENLQLEILTHSIFSIKATSILSIFSFVAEQLALFAFGVIVEPIPILFIIAGLGFEYVNPMYFAYKIGEKQAFIEENKNIIYKIFNSLIVDIKKETNLKEIEKEGIIALSDSEFNEKMTEIKDKFRQEKFINKLKKKLDNNFNILLLGNTNAGKSTLINSFLKLSDENKAKEGEGIPVNTIEFKPYKNELNGNYYILHDTNGITNTGEHCIAKKIKRVEEEINRRIKEGRANRLIHCIWYCIAGRNVQDSDKELIEKLHNIYTTKQIPIIFIHTLTFSKKDSQKARNGLKKYLTEIYNDEKKAEDYLKKYYTEVLAKDYEYEYEDEDTGENKTKIRKPFGLVELEKLSKKEIEENGIKSAYFEYLKKDIIPILINAIYIQIFSKENIKKLVEASNKSIEYYLKALITVINKNDSQLSQETKTNNENSINAIYKEFDCVKNKLFDKLKNKLMKKNLEVNLKDFVEDCYNDKTQTYKKLYSLKYFKDKSLIKYLIV